MSQPGLASGTVAQHFGIESVVCKLLIRAVGVGDSRHAIDGIVVEREGVAVLVGYRSQTPDCVVSKMAGVISARQRSIDGEQVSICVVVEDHYFSQSISGRQHLSTCIVAEARRPPALGQAAELVCRRHR